MLLLCWKEEVLVGGERMEMSSAVPRRIGTRGVSSSAMMGLGRVLGLVGVFVGFGMVSKASIRPGVMMIRQSFGCMLSQQPLVDQ